MNANERVNILLVDDQPGKLLSYEVMLKELGEALLKASSANEAFSMLLRHEVAVILIDVCMPDLDGFELAKMIREHPRFQKTAIIFISAIHLAESDYLRGYNAAPLTICRCRWCRNCCAPRCGSSPNCSGRPSSSSA